jgi:O-antigen/teichoic acid export membrane protein
MDSELARKALRNVFFDFLGLTAPLLPSILRAAVIARQLGPTRMGAFSFAVWFAGTLGLIGDLGISETLAKYTSEYIGRGASDRAAFVGRCLVGAQLVAAAAASAVAAGLAWFLMSGSRLSVVAVVVAMVLPMTVQPALASVLIGYQRYGQRALIGLGVSCTDLGVILLAAWLGAGVPGMLMATLGGVLIDTAIYYRAAMPILRGPAGIALPERERLFRRIRSFALAEYSILLSDLIIWKRSEIFFLNWFSTPAEIALYSISFSLTEKLWAVIGSLTGTLLPLASGAYGRSGSKDIGGILQSALKYTQMIAVPTCVFGIFICAPLVRMIYGPSYLGAVYVLQTLLGFVAFSCTAGLLYSVLSATERQRFVGWCQAGVALLNILLDLALIPSHGAMGAAWANSLAQSTEAAILALYACRTFQIRFPWAGTLKIYVAALISATPVMLTDWARLGPAAILAALVVGAILYGVILKAWGELTQLEFKLLRDSLPSGILGFSRSNQGTGPGSGSAE